MLVSRFRSVFTPRSLPPTSLATRLESNHGTRQTAEFLSTLVAGSLTVDGSDGIPAAHERGSGNNGAFIVDILSVCDSTAPEVLIVMRRATIPCTKQSCLEGYTPARGAIVSIKQCFPSPVMATEKSRYATCRTGCPPSLP